MNDNGRSSGHQSYRDDRGRRDRRSRERR
jgi:hypothetical protein